MLLPSLSHTTCDHCANLKVLAVLQNFKHGVATDGDVAVRHAARTEANIFLSSNSKYFIRLIIGCVLILHIVLVPSASLNFLMQLLKVNSQQTVVISHDALHA